MIFNPLFLNETGNSKLLAPTSTKLSKNKYLFSDIVKVVMNPIQEGTKLPKENENVFAYHKELSLTNDENPVQLKLNFLKDIHSEKCDQSLTEILPTEIVRLFDQNKVSEDSKSAVTYVGKDLLNGELEDFISELLDKEFLNKNLSTKEGLILSLEDKKSAVNFELSKLNHKNTDNSKITVQTIVVPLKSKLLSNIGPGKNESVLFRYNNREAILLNDSGIAEQKSNISVYSFKVGTDQFESLTKSIKTQVAIQQSINFEKSNIHLAQNSKNHSIENPVLPEQKLSREILAKNIGKNEWIPQSNEKTDFTVKNITILKKDYSNSELLNSSKNTVKDSGVSDHFASSKKFASVTQNSVQNTDSIKDSENKNTETKHAQASHKENTKLKESGNKSSYQNEPVGIDKSKELNQKSGKGTGKNSDISEADRNNHQLFKTKLKNLELNEIIKTDTAVDKKLASDQKINIDAKNLDRITDKTNPNKLQRPLSEIVPEVNQKNEKKSSAGVKSDGDEKSPAKQNSSADIKKNEQGKAQISEININAVQNSRDELQKKELSVKVKSEIKSVSDKNTNTQTKTEMNKNSNTDNQSKDEYLNENESKEKTNKTFNPLIANSESENSFNQSTKMNSSVNSLNISEINNLQNNSGTRIVKSIEIVKELVQFLARKEEGSLTFKIRPAHLGQMKVTLDTIDNMLKARIEVESDQARQILERNIEKLHQELLENGIKLNSLNISLSNSKKQKSEKDTKSKFNNSQNLGQVGETEEEVRKKTFGYNTYEYIA